MSSKPRRPAVELGPVLLVLICCGTGLVRAGHADPLKAQVAARGRGVSSDNLALIGTAASGVVADLRVQKGMHVEQGQLLVRIECNDLEKELDVKKAQLGALEAALARVEHGPRPEELAVAAAGVELASTRMEQADADLKRIAPDGPTTSEAQLDRAKATVKETTAQLEEARAKLSLLHSGSRSEDISEAKFLRDAAKASVEEVSARLDRCSVRAPFSGTVVSTEVTLGQFVSAAAPQTLLELAGNDRPSVGDNVDQRNTPKNLHQTESR